MGPAQKRKVYISLAVTAVVLFIAGIVVGYFSRTNSICPDNKPPVAQQDNGLGQVYYRCADGRTVTSSD